MRTVKIKYYLMYTREVLNYLKMEFRNIQKTFIDIDIYVYI